MGTTLRNCGPARVLAALLLLVLAVPAVAQQQNAAGASLIVNGAGRLDATGIAVPYNSTVQPSVSPGAPLFQTALTPRTALQVRIEGTPGQPIVLATAASVLPSGLPSAAGFLELDPFSLSLIVDGVTGSGLLNQGAVADSSGVWQLVLPQGFGPGAGQLDLQAVVVDPSVAAGVRLTASQTIVPTNSALVASANFLDAMQLGYRFTEYLQSITTPDFRFLGLDIFSVFVQSRFGILQDAEFRFRGLVPDRVGGPAIVTGAPVAGQSQAFGVNLGIRFPGPPGFPFELGFENWEVHGWQMLEDGGVWRTRGDGLPGEFFAGIDYRRKPGNPNDVDVCLDLEVTVYELTRGQVTSVSVSGPQLQGAVLFSPATSAATGTIGLNFEGRDGPFSEWGGDIPLAQAGSSRLPWIDGSSQGTDVYSFTLTWDDGSTTGPIQIPLRSIVDVSAGTAARASAAAATPSFSSATLNNAGTPNATLDVTVNLGAMPGNDYGAFNIWFDQGAGEWEFNNLLLPQGTTTTVTLPVPGMMSGALVNVGFDQCDRFANPFFGFATFTP